jgi:hypothetical protein
MCELMCVFRYSQTGLSSSVAGGSGGQPHVAHTYLAYPTESQDSEILAASLSRQSSSGSYDQNSCSAIDTPSNYSDDDDDDESDASSAVDMG